MCALQGRGRVTATSSAITCSSGSVVEALELERPSMTCSASERRKLTLARLVRPRRAAPRGRPRAPRPASASGRRSGRSAGGRSRVPPWSTAAGRRSSGRAHRSGPPAVRRGGRRGGSAPSSSMTRSEDRVAGAQVRDRVAGPTAHAWTGSRERHRCAAIEGAERALAPSSRDAGEGGGVAQRVRARLGGAQLLHEVEEVARVVGLEGDDELLVVEPERVAGVEVDRGVLAADPDVLLHDPPALVGGERVPLARLDEWIDEQVPARARVAPPDATRPSTPRAWSWPGTSTASSTTSSGRSGPVRRGTRGSARGSGPG